VPAWVRTALLTLPAEMAAADHRAHALDRAIVDLAEAMVLEHRVGETCEGVVVESGPRGGMVQLSDPAVRGKVDGAGRPLGTLLRVTLTEADPVKRVVRFTVAPAR
jgi:exoribonuclease R